MSRVQIEWEGRADFSARMALRISDINYGQHVGHDALLSILHEARLQMLASKGMSEKDIGGCGLIMVDTAVVFKAEIFYPDTLSVDLAVIDVSRGSFTIQYRVVRESDGREVALAQTGMVCFDYERKRPARMPDLFKAAFVPGEAAG